MAEKDKKKKDIVVENLKGFIRLGASATSPGNIPTGHFNLDFAMHYGMSPDDVDLSTLDGYDPKKPLGLPRGKIIEIFGEEGGGKSSLALRVVGAAQKMGFKCAWIDTENSFQESLAMINGVNNEELYYSDMSNPDDANVMFFAEDILDAIVELCRSGIKVIVLDSVANMVPKARMEKNAEQFTVGVVARLMAENLGKIANYALKYGVLVIFINQLRDKIGVLFGDSKTTPGGKSLKFNASVRLEISKKSGKDAEINIDEGNGKQRLIGRKTYAYIKKNRLAKPYSGDTIEIPVYYEPFVEDIAETLFSAGKQLKVVKVRKDVCTWNELKIEGKTAFINHLKTNNLLKELYGDIKKEAEVQNSLLPPEIKLWASATVDENDGEVNESKSSNEEPTT